ncbi:HAD family hydrolase [Komagataeibacter xylinus]|uniref:HAD family hydrolase n=1 Tax=Komagataeibacter xylinus TaxID=28448 RepID=UPI000FDF70F4|nr:HAD family hydrolase [Komagataeibacter xylinus]AZV39353.1 HAD-IB family hydrolase [Komagataeibacter xylinus]
MDADVPAGTFVFFDFDGTLSKRDSLLPFLRFTLGTSGLLWTCLRASPWLIGYGLRLISNNTAKKHLLSIAFRGKKISALQEQGRIFADMVLPRMLQPHMMARLAGYQKAGCCCVLVSASLDIYLLPWTKAAGIDATLCSSLSCDASGQVRGGFKGANCHGDEKVRRIRAFLEKRGAGTSSTILAYGDSRGDIPMMKLANRAWWVRAHSVVPF